MKIRRLIGVMLVALLVVTGVGVVSVAAATTYTDTGGRFSFSVPDGYAPVQTQLTAPVIAGFVAASPAGANFIVQVREATGTLDAATAELQKRYASASDSEPGPSGIQPLMLGGKPAQRFDYFTNAQGSRFHISQVVAINGGALYILVFTAQEADFDTLTSQTGIVLSSFTFLGAGANSPSAQISNGSAVYSDPQGRFSFIVPIDFQMVDPKETAVSYEDRTSSGTLIALFYAYVDGAPGSENFSFNAEIASQRTFLTKERMYTIVSEQGMTLAGSPAYRFDVTKTYPEDGARVRSAFIFAAHGVSFYQLTFVSTPTRFDDFSGRLQALLSSFSFNGTPNPVTPPRAPSSPPTTPPAPPKPPVSPPANPTNLVPSTPAGTPRPDPDRG